MSSPEFEKFQQDILLLRLKEIHSPQTLTKTLNINTLNSKVYGQLLYSIWVSKREDWPNFKRKSDSSLVYI